MHHDPLMTPAMNSPLLCWQTAVNSVLALTLFCAGTLHADAPSRTLLGHRAVQRELKLTAEQQSKIASLLDEIDREIARRVNATAADPVKLSEEAITNDVLSKRGPELQQALTSRQANRLWEISMQASGPGVFGNNRIVRALKLTPEQTERLGEEAAKMVDEVTRLALDVDQDGKVIELKANAAKKECLKASLSVLTDQQRQDLAALMGLPFHLELLKVPNDQLPRPLTFVFGLNGQNAYVLMSSPDVRKELELSPLQAREFSAILRRADLALTDLRLKTLQGADADFLDAGPATQLKIVRKILDGAKTIHADIADQVRKLLTPEQLVRLEKHLVRTIGARAIEFAPIADRLKVTTQQTAAFATLVNDFDEQTAALRVVYEQKYFDYQEFDRALARLEVATRALLTPDQTKQLVELAK